MKDAAVEVEEEMMRRTTLRSVGGSSNQRSHSCDESASEGVQLLSPTLVESFRGKTALVPKRTRKSEGFGWTRSPTHAPSRARIHTRAQHSSDNQSGHDEAEDRFESARRDGNPLKSFDFDGFTLASVRNRQESAEGDRMASTARVSSRAISSSSHASSHFRPERSMPVLGRLDDEDLTLFAPAAFDAQYQQFQRRHQQQQGTRTRGGSGHSSSISSSTGSPDVIPPDLRSFTVTATGVVSNLAAEATPTPSSAASGRHRAAAVRASGWLEKRKGLVLKRWRAYYCLFKEDDSLCLYASEDTVNGRLEHRFSVLRVLLTDKNDSFHVIAVDSDGAARREEFRASVSVEWQRWFVVFRRFFDEDSLHEALLRKPELLLLDSPARMPPPPLSLSDASPKSNGSGGWYAHHRPSDRSSRASGNQFDNDQLVDSDRGKRSIGGGNQQEHRQSTGSDAESGRASLSARQPGKAIASRTSVGWSRVEPLPVGHASDISDCSSHKPRRLNVVDGLALQKTSACESLDGPVDELRSTMSLHSVPSGRSALESPTEGSDAPVKTTAVALVGWTGDLELENGQEEHRERRSASTRSSGPASDSVFGWSW